MTSPRRKPIYQGTTIDFGLETVDLPNGRQLELEIVRHCGAAAVVPLLADQRVVLIRQFRHAGGGFLLEIPAGRLEPGEAPEACARRELREETGYSAGSWQYLLPLLTTPGFTDEVIHLYLARDLTPGASALEEYECIDPVILPLLEALELIMRGEIRDGKTIVGLFTAARSAGLMHWQAGLMHRQPVPAEVTALPAEAAIYPAEVGASAEEVSAPPASSTTSKS